MRKMLLGTTAMAATALTAGAAEAQWDVSVGGFMNQWFGWGGNSTSTRYQSTDQWSNSEIHFNGRNTLDNGITFGFRVELEGNTTADQIDESYLFIQSAELGRVLLGSENSAGYLMTIAAPNVGLGVNSGSTTQHIGNLSGGSLFRSPFGSTFIEPAGDNDGQKLTYFTPRYEGFQFGVSYLPDVDPTGGDVNGLKRDDIVGTYNTGLSLGLNYVNSFGPVDFAASGGFFWAEGPHGQYDFVDFYSNETFFGPTNAGINRSVGEDFQAWSVGASVSWAGFTLGGSFAKVEEGRLTVVNAAPSGAAGVSSTEGQGWDAGLSYEQGPWGFSVTYFQGVEKGVLNIPDNRFSQQIVGNVRYDLAPGVSLVGAVGAAEFKAEDDLVRTGGATVTNFGGFPTVARGTQGGLQSNSGVFVTGGVLLSF